MKCDECDGTMTSARENWKYDESGLPHVVLEGVEVRRCPSCGTSEPVIPRIEELHRVLAHLVTAKRSRLAGAEVKFLRKVLGFSGADLARHMGVTPESVSRWENERETIGPQADRLLRLMAITQEPKQDYSLDELTQIADEARPVRARVRASRSGWTEVLQP